MFRRGARCGDRALRRPLRWSQRSKTSLCSLHFAHPKTRPPAGATREAATGTIDTKHPKSPHIADGEIVKSSYVMITKPEVAWLKFSSNIDALGVWLVGVETSEAANKPPFPAVRRLQATESTAGCVTTHVKMFVPPGAS